MYFDRMVERWLQNKWLSAKLVRSTALTIDTKLVSILKQIVNIAVLCFVLILNNLIIKYQTASYNVFHHVSTAQVAWKS